MIPRADTPSCTQRKPGVPLAPLPAPHVSMRALPCTMVAVLRFQMRAAMRRVFPTRAVIVLRRQWSAS